VSVLGLGSPSSGPISTASQVHTSTSGGQPYTLVQGQVDQGVTRVTLALADGSKVQATVGDGSFIAWWPGSAAVTSAQLTSASGASTQQLTFTPVPEPTAPSGNASGSAPSSP
jgi:hypothetical protein